MRIKYKIKICSECGKERLIVQKSLNLCTVCNSKRLLKRYSEKRKDKINKGNKVDKVALQKFYKEVWEQNHPFCYETGEQLWKFRSWHIHHVLHKEDYPNLAFNHDVCVLLTLEQHSLWHSIAPSDRAIKMPKTYQKYLELCEYYNLNP